MKIYLIFFLLLSSKVFSQPEKIFKKFPPIVEAKTRLEPTSPFYNPALAFEIFKQEAEKGNAEAMNSLGILFSKGLGTKAHVGLAVYWLKKSATAGYSKAYTNLGLIYKDGIDVPQNFSKAVANFHLGYLNKSTSSTYYLGYMRYKGLGCQQNYEHAVKLFRESVKAELGSAYMLGICFRNGYGIKLNLDSAKYWLTVAASKGFKFAADELQEEHAENQNSSFVEPRKAIYGESKSAVRSHIYSKVTQSVQKGTLAGNYSGYIIRYDWSGKFIIGQSKLTLSITGDSKNLNGIWTEDENNSIPFHATLTDSALIFDNTSLERIDHYSAKKITSFEFRNAKLKHIKVGDSTYLAGIVQLHGVKLNEPEKPIYISVTKISDPVAAEKPSLNLSRLSVVDHDKPKLQVLENRSQVQTKDIKVYPNPFNKDLQTSFELDTAESVHIYLFDMSGRQIYGRTYELSAGKHTIDLQIDVPSGSYIFKLNYRNISKTSVVIRR